MAEGALGISTGIGQGEAQIIKPFQSPVTPQQYGAVMAAQKKAEQDKKDKQAKAVASVADFQFKGLPQHAELFAKGYNDIIDFAYENIYDPLIEFKVKQKMADLNTKANMSADLKANLQKQADFVQQGQGKNYYLGFDEAVKDVVAPIDYNTFLDTNKFGQAIGSKASLLNSVKTVPIYDTGAANVSLQNQVAGYAKNNLQGRSWETPETVIDSMVEKELIGHPEAIVHFERVMKNDPVGAKAAGNDPYQYGFNVLKKDLKAKGFTPEPKGDTNIINVDTSDTPALQGTSKPVIQNVKIARGFGRQLLDENGRPTGEIDYSTTTESVPLNVVTLPNKITLGTTVWPNGTIQVSAAGTITDISGQPASKDTSFGQFAGDTFVATKTVEKTVNGKKFIINAGEIVDPAKIRAFKETTGIDIPYKEQPIALIQSDNGYIYTPSTPYGEPVGLSYMGAKGKTPKGQAVEKGIKITNKTTGNGKSTTFKMQP